MRLNDNSDAAGIFVMFVAGDNEIVASQGLRGDDNGVGPEGQWPLVGTPAQCSQGLMSHSCKT